MADRTAAFRPPHSGSAKNVVAKFGKKLVIVNGVSLFQMRWRVSYRPDKDNTATSGAVQWSMPL